MAQEIAVNSIFEAPRFEVAAGASIAGMLEQANVPETLWDNVAITLNGVAVDQAEWSTTHLVESDNVALFVIPMGGDSGKQILRLVAMIAVVAAASWIAGPAGGAWASSTFGGAFAAGTTGNLVLSAGIAMVGTMAINALIPPPTAEAAGLDRESTYYFSGQSNRMRPYEIIPILYGEHKMVANLASYPEVLNAGTASVFTGLYDWGLGNVVLSDVRAGDTELSLFDGRMATLKGVPELWDPDNPQLGRKPIELRLMNYPLKTQSLNLPLTDNVNMEHEAVFTTAPDSSAALVDFQFPAGLYFLSRKGKEREASVAFQVEIRKKGVDAQGQPYNWRAPSPLELSFYFGAHLWVQGEMSEAVPNPGDPLPPPLIPNPGRLGVQFQFLPDAYVNRSNWAQHTVIVKFDQPVWWEKGWNKTGRIDEVLFLLRKDRYYDPHGGSGKDPASTTDFPPGGVNKTPRNPNNYPVDEDGIMDMGNNTYAFEPKLQWGPLLPTIKGTYHWAVDTSRIFDRPPPDGYAFTNGYVSSRPIWIDPVSETSTGPASPTLNAPEPDVPLDPGQDWDDNISMDDTFSLIAGDETYVAIEERKRAVILPGFKWEPVPGASAIYMLDGASRPISENELEDLQGPLMHVGPQTISAGYFRRTAYYALRHDPYLILENG